MQSMIKPTPRHKVYIKSKLSARNVLLSWLKAGGRETCFVVAWPFLVIALKYISPNVYWTYVFLSFRPSV